MFEKFVEIEHRFMDIERKISDPEIIANQNKYQELIKKHSELKEIVDVYRHYQQCSKELADAKELLEDPEMKEMAQEEVRAKEKELSGLEEALRVFLVPKDPNDEKNAQVEIRSGTGGDEAALFASELYRMYVKYAENKGWKVDVLSENVTPMGGIKEIVFSIMGRGVYGRMKFESGTHRVQRVPETEASGRLHTSAATVAIMPEAEEVDVSIDTKDLRIDTYRASGAGGQHVNKTDSAVRITHLPTGIVAACQDERSQFQNREKAMRVLRTKLYEVQLEEQMKEQAQIRKIQVGSGDRSQKIRTYNFPQNRVTDHRINLTLYDMQDVLIGKLDGVIEPLIAADRLEKLQK